MPPAAEQPSKEQYVEELAGPDDYWMTITDTARVTRRQDITIRPWIASGDLPVRKNRVGLNRRARQVRASDVAKLTPIIDASAMISGEEARINLTNIPAEQAAIRADHQQLMADLAALRAEMSEQKLTTEQAMAQQQQNWQQELRLAQELYSQAFAQQQQAIEVQQQTLAQMHTNLLAQLDQHAQAAQQQQRQLNQLHNSLLAQETRFQGALLDQQRTLEASLAQQHEQVDRDITGLRDSLAETSQAITHTTKLFTDRLAHLEQVGLDQAARQAQQIQELQASFQQAQQAIEQQVARLATRLTAYQSKQEQSLTHTEERLHHIQAASAQFQQEQSALLQSIDTLAAQFTEQQALQEQRDQQAKEQFSQLQESIALLKQQVSSLEKALVNAKAAPVIRPANS